jgi:hypothetical protein
MQGAGANFGLVQLQSLLEEHGRMKEMRERREKERAEKDAKRQQVRTSPACMHAGFIPGCKHHGSEQQACVAGQQLVRCVWQPWLSTVPSRTLPLHHEA